MCSSAASRGGGSVKRSGGARVRVSQASGSVSRRRRHPSVVVLDEDDESSRDDSVEMISRSAESDRVAAFVDLDSDGSYERLSGEQEGGTPERSVEEVGSGSESEDLVDCTPEEGEGEEASESSGLKESRDKGVEEGPFGVEKQLLYGCVAKRTRSKFANQERVSYTKYFNDKVSYDEDDDELKEEEGEEMNGDDGDEVEGDETYQVANNAEVEDSETVGASAGAEADSFAVPLKKKKFSGIEILVSASEGKSGSGVAVSSGGSSISQRTRSRFRLAKPIRKKKKLGTIGDPYDIDVNESESIDKSESSSSDEEVERKGRKKNMAGDRMDVDGIEEGIRLERLGKLIEKKGIQAVKDGALYKLLVDTIQNDEQELPAEFLYKQDERPSSPKELPPLIFSFGDEIPTPVEKSDAEKKMDELWADFDFAMGLNNIGSYGECPTEENNPSEAEADFTALCLQGKHQFVLDEQFGISCRNCSFVYLEMKHVLPSWATCSGGKLGRKRAATEECHSILNGFGTVGRTNGSEDSFAFPNGTVWDHVPQRISKILYQHQHEAFEFMWKNLAGGIQLDDVKIQATSEGVGGCVIAHAPGTGKTRLAIVFIYSYMKVFPNCRPVIVAPSGMLCTWEEEFRKLGVDLPIHNMNASVYSGKEVDYAQVLAGKERRSPKLLRALKLFSWVKSNGVLLISYSLFNQLTAEGSKNDPEISKILQEKPGLLVFDEGHTPRNERSLIWKALEKVKTEQRIILSGTLFQNNLREFYNSLVLVRPKFAQKISPRTAKICQKKVLSLDSVRDFSKGSQSILTAGSLRLNPNEGVKSKFVAELVRLCQARNEKVLVFSQYLDPLSLIKEQLIKLFNWSEGKEVLQMDGKISSKLRQSAIDVFNDLRSEARVLLASMKACSEGISLVGASRVVLLDVVWNPSVERQAVSRAFRLGQEKCVYTYHLITPGSGERAKHDRQAKRNTFQKCFKKSGNVQQYRVNQVSAGSDVGAAVSYQAANRAVQNGAHVQVHSHGSSDAPTTSGAKPVDSSRNSRTLPKAPPPQSAAGASDSAAPLRPAKGDASNQFTLQFGTISPGIMNGMQIPARTSSAPPNLDEQKSDQARHDSFRAMPTLPLPAAPKQQQQTRKDVGVTKQSSPGESHPQTQTKKEVHMQNPPAPTVALPKPSVLPVTGTPMPVSMPFQQPQVSLQFGGPGIQLQSQGVTAGSVQMQLTFPVGGAPQVPQQMFVSALQSHPMQPQAIMHQGQGFGFAPQIGHQLPSQLGNLGIAIGPQFGPQQPGKFGGQRKATVKITHPETHEELRLDQRTDSYIDGGSSRQRSIANLTPQSQPLPTFTSVHQMNYYSPLQPNTYGPPLVYPTATSIPISSSQMSTHATRHGYTVGPSGQPVSFMNPPILNPITGMKTGPPLHGVPESVKSEVSSFSAPSSSVQVSIKPSIGSHVDKIGTFSATSTAPISEVCVESNLQQPVPVSEPSVTKSLPVTNRQSAAPSDSLLLQRSEHECSSAALVTPVGDPVAVAVGTGGRKREPITRSNSSKEYQKKPSKKDMGHMQQQQHQDTLNSVSVEVTKSSSKATKNSSATDISSQQEPGFCDNQLKTSGAVEDEAVLALPTPTAVVLEKETTPNANLCCSYESTPNMIGIPTMEGDSAETSTSVVLNDDGIVRQSLDSTLSQTEHDLVEVGPKSEMHASQDTAGTEDSDKSATCLSDDAEKQQLEVHTEDLSSCVGVDQKPEQVDGSVAASDNVNVKSGSFSHLLQENANVDKISPADDVTIASKIISHRDVDTSDHAVPLPEATIRQIPVSLGTGQNREGKAADLPSGNPVTVAHSGPKDKPTLEPPRAKTASGKKKLLKEILLKADSAGSSDLYNAYKSTEEKKESTSSSECKDISSTVDTKNMSIDDPNKESVCLVEDKLSKGEVDDWEDAADISTLKLGTSENNHHAHGATKHADEYGNEATGRKKYSRDFLMTLSEQCMELPAGFEIGYDIANSLMTGPVTVSYAVDREPHPSPGRSTDRSPRGPRVDRRMVGVGDDDKWSKLAGSSGPGHDLRLDIGHGAPAVSFRPGQGVNHGVLRNPRGQSSNQYAGGILSGPIQAMASPGGVPQNGIDADRWHRASSAQRGLIPSPQTPLQVMHKATRKYEVGKVSDVEQAKQRQLKSILNKLTPQNFEKLFAQVKEVNIDNPVTLTGVISQIFDKALMEPTFCEMYADFCYHLSAELPDFSENNEKITFKRLLLNKCQEEFERGEREQAEADKADEEGEIQQTEGEREEKRIKARRRMLGNIRLIGELYKKKMLTERIMHECIKKLLGQYQNPDEEDLEALCKLMSTIGQMIDHSKAKEHMDAYFDMMLKLSTNQKLSSRVRFMLRDAIDLRKNRWQQRRKIEGPKKIEEVHRDVAHERQAQTSRLARGPVISSTPRRGAAVDFGPRGSSILSSHASQQMGSSRGFPPQTRGAQDVRVDDRHPLESKTLSSLLPQRPTDDDAITLGPKGGLGRGMTIRGQPLISNAALTEIPSSAGDPRRTATGPNGYSAVSCNSRDEVRSRDMLDRLGGTSYEQSSFQRTYSGSRDSNITDHTSDRPSLTTSSTGRIHGSLLADPITSSSHSKPLSEEGLRDKSMSAIREYYSAKDDEEVVLCIKELNSTNFYPTMISLWITDSFERKDMERDLLARLLVKLNKSQEHVLSETQLIQGFENVLSSLEDAMNDAPKAAEFLGRLFAKVILESAVPLKEVGRLILKGGEEPGQLLETGVASEVLGSILESIQNDKGDSILNEIRTNSGLRLEDFRPPQPLRAKKLEPFL
ncbi:hypothetical protein J5N97_029632 [Dioscorea zingiberensis]|uniref:Eukaryotic translation initiation factor 4G n=1 Tax=Dioscorea zingiberensis TaxID=325984 RepID=A0A9D5H3E2_9LILI|nr:hypothetical protein J5N97_029632 [Dioscorea zingiberensis]